MLKPHSHFLILVVLFAGCRSGDEAPAAEPQGSVEVRCEAVGRDGERPGPGLRTEWDTSFDCKGAPDLGQATVEVSVDNPDDTPLVFDRLELVSAVPGPLRQAVADGRIAVGGLGEPVTVPAMGATRIPVRVSFVLAQDESGRKNANVKLALLGKADGRPVNLLVNVHFRAELGPEPGGAGRPQPGDSRFEP
jgi:hypothetical protein